MSLTQDYLDRWLRLDVESYFKGHEPQSIELARAPPLQKWRVSLVHGGADGLSVTACTPRNRSVARNLVEPPHDFFQGAPISFGNR
jgi:hypothetical protein